MTTNIAKNIHVYKLEIEKIKNRLSQIKNELKSMSSLSQSSLKLAACIDKVPDDNHQLSKEIVTIAAHSQACISQMEMVLAESQNQLYRTEAILEKNQEKLRRTVVKLKDNQNRLYQTKIKVNQFIDRLEKLKLTSTENQEIVSELQSMAYQLLEIVSLKQSPIRRVYIRGCPRSGNTLMLLLCGPGFKNSHVLAAQGIPIPSTSNPNQITFGTFPSPEGFTYKQVQADHFLDFEDAAIIFMIRDPRDVLVSEHGAKPGEPWIKDPKRWIDNALILKKVKEHERVLLIKYEDLVTEPDAIQEKMAVQFGFEINRPFSDCWQHFQPISPDYLKSIKEIKPLEIDKIGVWNKDPKKKDYVTQKLAQRPEIYDLMKEFGYLSQNNHNLKPITELNQRPEIKPPLLANGAVEFLQQFLQQNPHARVLEFGSGGSTVWFSTYTKNVVSIEHNREWYDRVKRDLAKYDSCHPVDLRLMSLPYHGVCEDFQDESFDLILVDGRNRVRCAQAAIRILKTGGILMLDDAQRPYYQRVHNLLQNWEYSRRIHPQRQTDWWVKPPNFKSTDSDWARIFKQSPIRLYAGSLSPKAKQDGWVGLAHHRSDQWHIKHDLTKLMPIPDEVVDCFQAEDVIEHIEPADLLAVTFPEIYRVMKSGGFIRISVPDYKCDYLINRCWKNDQGEPYYDPQGGGKWDAKRKRVTPGGHVWLPTYERLRSLIELSPLRNCKANWLHYYDTNGQPVIHDIDYSKGYVMRTPDHDNRVKNPRRPLSIVVDLYKD
ncbi:MAG: methyltransferase domain-containing protein [Arthrospira sp. SH-MAG29]|nr:methyltransferase domain-containing protein [Arthrospira sp. SH-MAG29]MBS0016782.1 methyltransferase domain-containing protein [Arthrospira sp. SH-MAG29]